MQPLYQGFAGLQQYGVHSQPGGYPFQQLYGLPLGYIQTSNNVSNTGSVSSSASGLKQQQHAASTEHKQKQEAYRSFMAYAGSTLAAAYVKVRSASRLICISPCVSSRSEALDECLESLC